MKKLLLLLCALLCLLPLTACGEEESATPAASTHTHTAAVGYAYDERHHWNPCTVGDCNIKLNWKEHAMGAGEITSLPNEEGAGVRTYRCSCGYTKTEPVDYEGVDDALFDSALFDSTFEKFTVRVVATEQTEAGALQTDAILCFDGDLLSVAGTVLGEEVSRTESDAELVESYKSILLFFRHLSSQMLTFNKTDRIYYAEGAVQFSDRQMGSWECSNIGIKISGNRITYAACDYVAGHDAGRSGHMELTLYGYGNTNLQ